nr:putative ribonuclease H-like domain-containing protein [Tanacetum cinerariifolium]
MWSSGSINPQNYDGDAAFNGKEHDFDVKKPEDLNAEFKDCSDNNSNDLNATGSIVPTVGQNSLNNTNTFSATGPSNTAISLTYGKSSFIDASQLFDDPDMLKLEDITYSDDENVVGVEADFNNLETSITATLKDPSWIEAMQEELLQFKMQKVWVLVDLPHGKRAIASTTIDTDKPLLKDPDGEDVDVHIYRALAAVILGGELLVFGNGLRVMGDLDLVTIGWASLGRVTMILGTTALTNLTVVLHTGLD